MRKTTSKYPPNTLWAGQMSEETNQGVLRVWFGQQHTDTQQHLKLFLEFQLDQTVFKWSEKYFLLSLILKGTFQKREIFSERGGGLAESNFLNNKMYLYLECSPILCKYLLNQGADIVVCLPWPLWEQDSTSLSRCPSRSVPAKYLW